MRDIKFRGKVKYNGNHKFSGDWIYGYYRNNDNKNAFITETLDEYSDYIFDETEVEESTIGQFTGLKDKNGKEIYEGDIVKVENIDLAQIIYDEDRMAWGIKPIDEFYFDSPFLADNISLELEVIGNIYDNPDLIKE